MYGALLIPLIIPVLAFLTLLLTACSPIPVQMTTTSQSSRQTAKQTTDQDVAMAIAEEQIAKQGTQSMPVIVICNTTNSPHAQCATPKEGNALTGKIDKSLGKKP